MFDNLKSDETIKEAGDFLGGAGVLDTNVYPMAIDMAYLDTSKGGAMNLNLTFVGQAGEQLRQTLWMTSGTAKGGKNYYLDKKQNKQYLPGFSQANALCLLTLGKEISEVAASAEDKTISIYNYDLKKDVPTEKKVLTALLGQQVLLGVMRQTVDKTANDGSGNYLPTGETRDENEIDKIFRMKDNLTVAEIRAGETEGSFKDKWLEKNKGNVKNKATSGVPNTTSGVSTTASLTPVVEQKSLFD